MLIAVYARNHLKDAIGEVATSSVACGVLGVGGNKGAVAVEFSVHRRRVAVLCSHFAAHQVGRRGGARGAWEVGRGGWWDDRGRVQAHSMCACMQPALAASPCLAASALSLTQQHRCFTNRYPGCCGGPQRQLCHDLPPADLQPARVAGG